MGEWQDISTAPKDGTVFDVWLGDTDEPFSPKRVDIDFYCTKGTRRSPGWTWAEGKFRPCVGLPHLTTFVQPTHFMPLPPPPKDAGK